MSDDVDNSLMLVYVVWRDEDEAKRVAFTVLSKRLAACTNFFPLKSSYWWDGQLVDDSEVGLLIKTRASLFDQVKNEVLASHSYETPCVIGFPASKVHRPYLEWLYAETTDRT